MARAAPRLERSTFDQPGVAADAGRKRRPLEALLAAARPQHPHTFGRRGAEPELEPGFALGSEPRAAAHFPHQRPARGLELDACADRFGRGGQRALADRAWLIR